MDPRLPRRLDALLSAFRAANPGDLKRIGNDAIADAALGSDHGLATVSVVAYSLYKMLTKEHFTQSPRWQKVSDSMLSELGKSLGSLEKNDIEGFRGHMGHVIGRIEQVDDELSNYARNIFDKAKIKQASTAYALGMSLSQAAELTNADRNELQRYIGITRIHDEQPAGKGIAQRLLALKAEIGR